MLSRATSLEGLLVLRPATRAELTAGGPPWLLAELDRLEQLERESHEELVQYLESFPDSVIPRTIKDLLSEDAPRREAMRVAEVRAGSAPQQSSPQSGVSVRPPHSVALTSQTRDRPAAPELAAARTAPAGQSRKRLHQKTPDSNALRVSSLASRIHLAIPCHQQQAQVEHQTRQCFIGARSVTGSVAARKHQHALSTCVPGLRIGTLIGATQFLI